MAINGIALFLFEVTSQYDLHTKACIYQQTSTRLYHTKDDNWMIKVNFEDERRKTQATERSISIASE